MLTLAKDSRDIYANVDATRTTTYQIYSARDRLYRSVLAQGQAVVLLHLFERFEASLNS